MSEDEKKINHCSELLCPANSGKGACRIKTCLLIFPKQGAEELQVLQWEKLDKQIKELRKEKIKELRNEIKKNEKESPNERGS